MQNVALYIHWPFCKSKCPYCDFNSHVRESIELDRWNKAYLKEIENNRDILKSKKLVSIFFGGGTPSLMPSFIVKNIIDKVTEITSTLSTNIEITLEANPTSVESNKFKEFSKAGVNRVSIGVQSLNPNDLKFLGREHNVKEAKKAIDLARENFPRYSFDLIYALPNQTLSSWKKELNEALNLVGDHLSLYQLTIEKGTPFYKLHQDKKFIIPSENLAKNFYNITQEVMNDNGLRSYEISNHAKPNSECIHNLVYWQYDDFIGIGPGAHGRVNGNAISNIYHPENWLKGVLDNDINFQTITPLSLEEKINEILLMGLRLKKGVNEFNFYQKTGLKFNDSLNKNKLDFLLKENFLELQNHNLYATDKGKLVLNFIIEKLIIPFPLA